MAGCRRHGPGTGTKPAVMKSGAGWAACYRMPATMPKRRLPKNGSPKRIRIEKREAPSQAMIYATPVIAGVLSLLFGLVIFAALGKDPLYAFYVFFIQPVSTWFGVGELAIKAAPLLLLAAGLTVVFRAGVWSIGAEGQLRVGAR